MKAKMQRPYALYMRQRGRGRVQTGMERLGAVQERERARKRLAKGKPAQ